MYEFTVGDFVGSFPLWVALKKIDAKSAAYYSCEADGKLAVVVFTDADLANRPNRKGQLEMKGFELHRVEEPEVLAKFLESGTHAYVVFDPGDVGTRTYSVFTVAEAISAFRSKTT